MKIEKSTTIAFTGHRSNRITADTNQLKEYLYRIITDFYFRGFRMFLTGMSEGFDLIAAEAVLKLKTVHTDIRLVTVIPFTRQASRFSTEDQRRYGEIFKQCDDSVLISEHYHEGCFHRRNDYLTDNASHIIACFDGQPKGGTYYTVQRAINKQIPVRNLFDYQQAHEWWNSLDSETKAVFAGNCTDIPTDKFWLSLHPSNRKSLYNYWRAKTGQTTMQADDLHSLQMEIICELAELTMEHEFNVSRNDMYNKDGNYYEKYQDRFNDLYDEVEDRLLNHDFVTE